MTNQVPTLPNPVYDRLLTGLYRRMRPRVPAYRPNGGADYLMMLTVGGAGRIKLADGSLRRSSQGDFSIHSPHVMQWYAVDGTAGYWSIIWVHFHPRAHWLEWISSLPEASPGLHWGGLEKNCFRKVKSSLLAMHEHEREGSSLSRDFAMNFLEAALLRICESSVPGDLIQGDDESGIAKAVVAIGRSLAKPPPVPELARIAGMSVSGFAHRFKEATGMAPLQYSLRLRLERAESLLRCTPMTVKEVASELGFDDPFYFSRLFRKRNGAGPASWRASSLA